MSDPYSTRGVSSPAAPLSAPGQASGTRCQPPAWTLPGFGPMTRITTDFGDFPAQTLRVGDRVRTRRGPFKRIVWLDRYVLDEAFLACHPEALPILIRPGAFGPGLPLAEVVVSPAQRIHGPRMQPGVRPQPAGLLTSGPRIMRKPETIFTYTLFHCDELVDVHVTGLWIPIPPRAPAAPAED
ncbi:Hint domain-containing protein [Rhodovulum euryhalinum]|uniref:Hint domain-containing protein n=2 Tax=Rhodovulum euryhalinum TaxID=35805 RepID=A0A4R2KTI0_9RHOB|nr:Hint domain-containing protein [Rhodovulum euryhalinum]